MKKNRILILEEESSYLANISSIDLENLKLFEQYLPNLKKKKFGLNEQEKEIILKYNSLIENIKQKTKTQSIPIDFVLKKVDLK